jgi:transposase
VENLFRTMKSILDTRPIYHKCDDTIRGHVFCSFLALVLQRELQSQMREASHKLLKVEKWSPEGDTVALRNFQFSYVG